MTVSTQEIEPTFGEQITELFSRIAKLNDQMAAVLAPEWGARMGIIPEGHPLHPGVEQAEPRPVSPDLAERIRTLIESEMYEYRERTCFWPEGGITAEIARLATRGALEALAATGPRILCANTRPGSHTTVCDLPAGHGDHRGATGYGERVTWPADGTETTARVFAGLHHSAEQDVTRVINLYENWVKAGPPIGVSMTGYFEWWREHLAELHDAILPTAEQPRTTANNSPTSGDATNNPLREQYAAIIRSECGSRFEYVTRQLLAVHQRDTAQLRRERDMALKAAREARGDVAHDAGPSVAECRDHDRAWDVEQETP